MRAVFVMLFTVLNSNFVIITTSTNPRNKIMIITHTSPVKITDIDKNGMFDDCLFFSNDEYSMTTRGSLFIYSLELSENKVISAINLYNESVITNIMSALDVNEEDAESLLDGTLISDSGEDDWWIQAKQGECARLMGYDAAELIDEQGVVYIVPMTGKLGELTLERIDA